METWATVALVLGSNVIIALTTFFATKMQISHSDRRFQIEQQLEQQRIVREMNENNRQRRREIRSEPLLKLRNELARMASMQNEVVDAARQEHDGVGVTKEQAKDRLKKALSGWDAYRAEGNLLKSLFMQYDAELFNKVMYITKAYQKAYDNLRKSGELKVAEIEDALRDSSKVWPKVIEVQELINKQLEEL